MNGGASSAQAGVATLLTGRMPEPPMAKTASGKGQERMLTPEQHRILREKWTEPAFCGKYWDEKRDGRYFCAGCGALLFESGKKFDSGTGWPSFLSPARNGAVKEQLDESQGMNRTEVLCAKCGGHLGHVFDDGPPPAGKRYCINSGALVFEGK